MATRVSSLLLIALAMLAVVNPLSSPATAQSPAEATAQSTAQAANQPTNSPLLDLLAYVPNNAAVHPSSGIGISYADYRAAEKVGGITSPGTGVAFSALDQQQLKQVVFAYSRLYAG